MSDEINIKVIVDPNAAQAGAAASSKAIQDAADSINASLKSVVTSSNSTGAAIRSGFSGVEDELKKVQSAMAAATTAITQGSASIVGTLNQIPAAGRNAAGGMNHVAGSMRGVRRELIVMGHEILTGNWSRLAGSTVVLAERMDFMRSILSPTGAALGLVAGAIIAVGIAAIQGAMDISRLNNELALTGNRAGLTQDSYLEMAGAIAAANAKMTVGNARASVSAVAGTGAFGPGAVQAVSSAVAEITRLSGETAVKVAADFAKMDEGVFKWATTNKEAKNLVSGADAEYARTLEEQGRKEEAEIFIAQRISSQLKSVENDLGILPGLWNSVGAAASAAWNAMMNIGRPDTLGEALAKLKDKRQELAESNNGGSIGGGLDGGVAALGNGGSLAVLDKQIAAIEKQIAAKDALAKKDAQTAADNDTSKKGAAALDESSIRYDKAAAKAKELADAQLNLNNALKGLPPVAQRSAEQIAYATKMQKEYDETVKGINERGPKAKKLGAGGARAVGQAEDTGELAILKDRLSFEEAELQRSYKANTLSLEQYYAQRKAIVKEGMDAEIAVAQRGVANAEGAAKYARSPNEQASAQAAIVRAKNQVALLNQKLDEQERTLTQEMEAQKKLQDNKLATIGINTNQQQALAAVQRAETLAQMETALGNKTKGSLLGQEMQFEEQRYAIEKAALDQRSALEDQTLEQQAELNQKKEALESAHQQKMLALAAQEVEQQGQLEKQISQDMENDFAQAFGEIVSRSKTVKAAFEQLIPQFEKQLGTQVTKSLTTDLFSSIGGQLKTGINAVFGNGLFGGGSGILGGGASSQAQTIAAQTISAATTANNTVANSSVASMSVGNMIVANSAGGGGGGGGGGGDLGSMLGGLGSSGDMAGSFGFTAAGVTGSSDAVAAGAMSDASGSGMSALMGIAAFAKGTNYVPSTGLAMLHQGEAVIPASQNTPYAPASPSMQVNNQFLLPNNVDLRTQNQISAMAGQSIQRALQRNT